MACSACFSFEKKASDSARAFLYTPMFALYILCTEERTFCAPVIKYPPTHTHPSKLSPLRYSQAMVALPW